MPLLVDMLSLVLSKAVYSNILLLLTYLSVDRTMLLKKENYLFVFLDDMFVC